MCIVFAFEILQGVCVCVCVSVEISHRFYSQFHEWLFWIVGFVFQWMKSAFMRNGLKEIWLPKMSRKVVLAFVKRLILVYYIVWPFWNKQPNVQMFPVLLYHALGF